MQRFFRKFTARMILLVNLLVILVFLLACITHHLNPGKWWFTGFLALVFPYLFSAVFLFFIFWLFFSPRKSLFSLCALLIGINGLTKVIAFNLPVNFLMEKKEKQLRVMDWNLRYFVPFNNTNFKPEEEKNRNAILNEIRAYQPDILCFQEFFENGEEKQMGNMATIAEDLNYPYHYFSKDKIFWKTIMAGTAIFSRYPIIRSELVKYPENISKDAENTIFTDILYQGDTIRVYSIHLQSFGFKPRDYQSFSKIENNQGEGLEASKNLLRKMRYTFAFHSLQSEFTMDLINKSPYPVIVCGDLNDVPNSYAYAKIRGDRKDAFLEKGSGIGKTFTSATSRLLGKLPTLRIDYIFTDPGMTVEQFTQINKRLSDHHGLIADIKLKEKE